MSSNRKIAILGGGITGLSAAYKLSQYRPGDLILFEREQNLGGMAASFQMEGIWTEHFYHFICKPDQAYLNLIRELGLEDQLRWQRTRMSYFTQGRLWRFGDPLSLLRFGPLSLPARLQTGWASYKSKVRKSWKDLENITSVDWLRQTYGSEAYKILWDRALTLKFHQYTPELSAAWIWTRIRRVALSRRNIFQEELGYLKGGTRTLIEKLSREVEKRGVVIRTGCSVTGLEGDGEVIKRVRTDHGDEDIDAVIATIPQKVLVDTLPLPAEHPYVQMINNIRYTALICLILQTKQPLTDSFWLNISDPDIPLAGLIEYTNLNPDYHPDGRSLWYVPEYLPFDHPHYNHTAEELLQRYIPIFKAINPSFEPDWVINIEKKTEYLAQPLCPLDFTSKLTSLDTPFKNFVSGDTCHFWPEDRTVTDAISLGFKLADRLIQ